MFEALYTFTPELEAAEVSASTLIVTLGAYLDAGEVQQLLDEHLLETLPHHRLVSFDVDRLLDYRARRPRITFDRDHFEDYQRPEIAMHHLLDASGKPFILLNGPEPALQWERMARDIIELVRRFNISRVITAQGIPLDVPHSRPVTMTRSASRPDLIPGNQPLFGRMQLSASFPSMLAIRLQEAGIDVVGLAAHIPQYLIDHDFPDAALALLRAIEKHGDLELPGNQLSLRASVVRAQIDETIQASEELSQVVEAVEERYDRFTKQAGVLPASVEDDLPSPDELGAQAEEFLKGLGE